MWSFKKLCRATPPLTNVDSKVAPWQLNAGKLAIVANAVMYIAQLQTYLKDLRTENKRLKGEVLELK